MSAEKEVQAVFYIGIKQAKEIVDLTDLNPLEVKAVKFVSYGARQAFAEVTVVVQTISEVRFHHEIVREAPGWNFRVQ